MANDTQAVSYDFESINPDFSLGAGASAADSPFAPLIQSAGSVTVSAPQESDEGRTIAGTAGDVAITALKGAIGLPEAAVGLLDIALGGRAGKTLEDLGYRPDDAKKILDGLYSEYQKRANRSAQEAEGFLGTVAAMLDNPSTIFHTALESSPQMLGGAAIARGILAGAPKIAPWVAGAMGEGAMGAGSAASQIRQESEDGLISGKQSWSALGSGAGTFALGAAGGKLAQKVGLTDVDTLLASGMKGAGKTARAGFIRQVLGSGISEGVLEELPQSMQEQMWQNYATGKPIMEGVDKAGAQGMMAGLALGGAGGGFNAAMSSLLGPQQDESAPTDPVADAAQQPNSPLSRAAVASRPKDDISTRVGEIEQLVRDGDLLQRLREIGNPSANTAGEFLEALAVARNPGAAPAARQQALDSLEEALGWIEAGAMPFDEATGSPFRTDLTVRPDDGPGDGPAGGAPVLPGPLALPDPNVIDVDATVVGEQAQEAAQAPAEEPAADIPTPPAQDAAGQPVDGSATDAGPMTDASAPLVNVRVEAPRVPTPRATAQTESIPAATRRRKAQLSIMAQLGFDTVERRGDGSYWMVNDGRGEEMRLENAGDAQRARAAINDQKRAAAGERDGRKNEARYEQDAALQAVAEHEGPVSEPEQPVFSQLRRSRHQGVPGVGDELPGVRSGGRGASEPGAHSGQAGQQPGVSARQRRMGDEKGAGQQYAQESGADPRWQGANPDAVGRGDRIGAVNPAVQTQAGRDVGDAGVDHGETLRPDAGARGAVGDTQEAGNVRDIGTVEQAAGDRQARAGGEGAGVDARRSVRDGEAAVDDRTNQAAEEARRDRELVEELAREIGDPSLRVAPRSPEADALRALLRAAKRVFGVHAIAVDTKSDRFDGVTHRGVVMVNVRDPQMHVAQTIGHELAHTQEESAAKLRERLWSLVSEDGRRAYYEGYLRRDEGWSYDRASDLELAKLKSEMLADFMGNRFNDRAWLESLARQRPALFGNFVRDWLRMLDNLIGALRGMARAMDPRAAKQVDKYITDLAQAREIAAGIAIEWAERHKGLAKRTGVSASLRETQFSRREETKRAYEQRIDELFAGGRPRLSGVRVLDRSDMVGLLGIGDGPVNLAEGKVVASESNHPRMTAEVWKKIPDWLDNPAMVFDSDTEPGRLVLVGPELVGGSPVRIILEPNASGAVSAHLLVNAYDAKASPFRRWERDGLLRYVDRNKFARVSGTFQPRLTGLPGDRRRGPILTDKHLAGWRKANPTQYSLRDSIEVTESDWADFQAELAAADTYASEFTAGAVTAADIQAEGLFAEEAFGDLRWSSDGERSVIRLPERDGAADTLVIEQKDSGKFELKGMPGTYVTAAQASTVRDYAARQVAARRLFDRGFDLLSTTAEDARQGLVDAWRNVSSRDQVEGTGAKRLGDVADASRSMKSILRDLGMPGNWSASVFSDRMPDGVVLIVEFQNADTAEVQPGVIDITERDGRLVATASTSQMRSGGMGTIFYQAASAYLARKGIPLAPDYGLSGINAYRRTEQMISAALRTGKSNAMLPHDAQRVYGFNERARSRSEHDENLGRLLLAGLRNAREIAPEIVGLTYHPETDSFTDRAGADAAGLVDGILQRDASRTFGLGRGTMARAALTQQALAGESIDADRFSSPVLYSARDQAAAEYAAVEAKHRGTDGWMKAPNGNPTNLNEGQWIQVRTPSFKAWFGDWERFAGTRDGVWGDSKGEVSKVVDGNGEPLVLYHGTDKGGFMSFKEPGGTGRGDLGIFATDDRSMARSYVRRNRVDDIVPPSSRDDLEDAGYQFEEDEDGVTLIDPDGYNSTFDTEQEAVDYALENFSAIGEMPGIYAVFANIRDPNEAYFEGANWDGSRNGQWTVWADDEQQSDPSGRMYFDSREDAEAFADTLEDAEVFSAEDHHESTDSVVDDARTFRNDGAIIHDVMDDGGGPGYYGDPAKVVVAFKPNQLKSADWNTGEFGSGDDLRYSARPVDFDDPADRIEVSTTVPTKKKGGRLVIDAVDDKWIIDADDIRSSKKHRAAAVAAIKTYNAVDMAGKSDAIKALHDTAVDNLIWLHNLMPADLRNRAKLWYDGANRVSQGLADRHGYDIRQVAGVMAVLSPQKDWFMNATLGERVIRIMRDHGGEAWSPAMTAWVNSYANAAKTVDERGKRSSLLETALRLEGQTLDSMGDADAARFVRVFDETYFPRTYRVLTPEGGFGDYVTNAPEEVDADADEAPAGSVAWGTYPSIEKAVAILRDNNPRSQLRTISGALGREHKVRNFYNNIVAPGSADGHVTIDTHAVAAALVKSLSGEAIEVMHNFGRAPRGTPSPGANVDSGASGVYGIYADAYRDAAARLGILPRELQSITWEAVRAIFTPGFKSTRSAEVEAIYDRYASGEISREQARQEAYELAGGLKALPWEDTPIGRMVEEGGTSFDGDIAADPADREARTLEPFDARDSITVSLSSATGTIPGIDALHDRANKGDAQAARLLQDVAFDALKHLLSGTSARIKRENATGLYGGEVEPSLGVTLTFGDSDRAQVLAALARFADNFNQQQIHVRRETNDAPGMVYDDGSYATPVYRWQLKQALDRKAIQRVIDRSGLYGLTFGDDFVEAYFVGDVTDESARQTFARAAAEADRVLGSRAEGSRRSVARLWPYGDSFAGEPTIGYERIRGDVSTQPVAALPTARRVAEYLNSVDGKPGRVKAFDQAAEITEEQRALQQGIARAYEALPDNDLKNPRVRRAYQALAREVLRQFNALPVRVEVFQGQGEPYANSDAMRRDLADNNHLYIFGTTDDTFGPPGVSFAGHPLLGDSGLADQNGHPLKFNDLLRAVHDYYAHAMSPTQFGPKGEEAAWKNHMAMTRDPWARWALTTETRGQNSWVNFRDDLDPSTPIKDRPFARQKAALIPAEYMLTGNRAVDAPVRRFIDSLPTQQRIGSKPVQYSARDRGPVEYRTVNNEVTDEQFDARGAGALAQGQAAGNRGAEQGERAGPDRGQPARAPGGASGGVGESDRAPRYGRARPGAVSAIGYHFSRQPREHLNGAYYGTGLKGLEAERLAGRENDDIRPRVYFYIDAGNGIRPEAGVGGSAHHVQLDNLYDAGTDPLDIKRRARAIPGNFFNNFEREVVAAGFDGYAVLDPADPQHFAVLIGRRHQSVPVAQAQPPAARDAAPRTMPAGPRPARTERRGDTLTRKPTNDELMELVTNAKTIQAAAPSFRMQWGSAMVSESEAAAADAALESAGAKFRFGQVPSYSRRITSEQRAANLEAFRAGAAMVPWQSAADHDFRTGEPVMVDAFHGTARPDRVGTVFRRSRATSGPMAYFTSSPELASSYAQGKQDTSLANEDLSYANWFKVKVPGQRSAMPVDRAWHLLDAETKARIAERMPDIRQDDDGNVVYEEGGGDLGNYEWELQQTRTQWDRQGNPLKAAVESWLNSGSVYGNEQDFMEVLRLAGMPMDRVEFDSPDASMPFVYKTFIRMGNPLVTSDIPAELRQALNRAALRDRSRARQSGADMWDKNTRTLREWVDEFRRGADESSHVWTSIPDKVTDVLKAQGYDGIIDRSNKGGAGAAAHPVYIPFHETQVKSALGNRGTFDPENPDIRQSRRVTTGDHGRAYTPEQRAMFENTGRTVTRATIIERAKEFRRGIGKKLAQGIVDQFRPIRDLDGHAYALARLSKGASGAFEALLNFGKLKIVDGVYDADMSGGFQEKVGMPLGAELDDFVWWVAANRAERLAGQGRENLFTPADIAAGKSLATGQMAHDYTLQNGQVTRDRALAYADSLQKLDAFNKNVLDIAEESGLIDGTTRPYWDDEFYVPFYRVSDDDGGFIGEKIKGGLARQRAFKELKGGSEKLHSDLVQNMLQNWAHLIDASAKNRAAKEAMEAALNVGIAIEASQDMVRQLQRQAGGGSGTAWFMDGGVQRHFLIEDPYVLEAINSLSYAGLKGPMMTALSRAKHWLTAGVTASPGFKVRNLIRDSLQAIATADMNYNPLTNVKHGIEITRKDNQTYVSALASGGLIRFGTGEASQAERMRKLAKHSVPPSTVLDTKGKVEAFYNKYLRPGVEAYQELGSRGEEITRAALYKQLVDKGVSPSEAALQARDLMDFSMQGTWGTIRFLTQVVPFLNARLQGLYKLGRAAKEDPRRFSIVLGATSLASIALLAAYSDDEDWKQREDWDRDGFWWFKFGGVAFRIPKPFEIGALASVAERGVELFTNDEFTAQRFMDRMKHLASDNLSMNPIPQAIKPILDVYANKDSFTGRPIESMGMERLQAEYRYNSYTSALARGASTAMNTVSRGVLGMETLSPVQIDHLTRGYFGWLGTFWVYVGDQALRPMLREPDRPSLDYLKVVTQGLALQLPAPQSKYVSAIYEQSQELDRVYATYRRMVREGKGQDAARFSAENADLLRRQKLVAQVKKTISKSNQRVRDIERDERMDSAEKRRRILREKALQSAAAQRVY